MKGIQQMWSFLPQLFSFLLHLPSNCVRGSLRCHPSCPTLGCCAQIGVLQEDNARLKAFNKYEEIERVQKLAAEETETVRKLLTAEADAARTKAAADVEAVRDSAASDAEAIRQA